MPYILAVEAQSIANRQMKPGDQIEVVNGDARKIVRLETLSRGRVTVYWALAGQYDVNLQTGELMGLLLPLNGLFEVDYLTGRIEGTRYSIAPDALHRIESLRAGDTLQLAHDSSPAVQAQVVDSLPSEGTLRIFVRTRKDAWAVGRTYGTGWRVPPETLAELRSRAGVAFERAS